MPPESDLTAPKVVHVTPLTVDTWNATVSVGLGKLPPGPRACTRYKWICASLDLLVFRVVNRAAVKLAKLAINVGAHCYYGLGMRLIRQYFLMWIGEGELNFNVSRCFEALKREVKREISDYYVTIFSRKAGPPICITLCILMIISFIVSHL